MALVEEAVVQTAVTYPVTTASARGLGLMPRILRTMLRFVISALFRFEISGLERLPRGAYLAAANHPAWLETMALVAFLPAERGLRFLASRAVTVDVGWRRWLLDRADVVVPIDLEQGDNRASIRATVEYLRSGASIGIFPEVLDEPTAPDGSVRPLRRGVAFLARSGGVPVVPIGVSDTRELWLGRRIRLTVGQPLDPPRSKGEDDAFLARLHDRLEALRPPAEPLPSYRPCRWLSGLF